MILTRGDGKLEFMAHMTSSRMEHFDQYASIRLESENEYGSNVSLSLEPDKAEELYFKTVRVTVEVIDG